MFQILEEKPRLLLKEMIESGNAQKLVDIKFDSFKNDHDAMEDLRHSLFQLLKGRLINGGWFDGALSGIDILAQGQSYFKDEEDHLDIMQGEKYKWHPKHTNGRSETDNNTSHEIRYEECSKKSIELTIVSINERIEKDGHDDKKLLFELLSETQEILQDIEETRRLPKRQNYSNKLASCIDTHNWFYGAMIDLIGQAGLSLVGHDNNK